MSSRAYRLLDGEELESGLRRIAAGRASKASERLREAPEGGFAASVHGARKDLKKLRSVIRLIREGLGEGDYRRENDRFRDAAQMLGAARDAEAKIECVEKLRSRFGGEFPTRWSRDFVQTLDHDRVRIAEREAEQGIGDVVARIDTGGNAAQTWSYRASGFDLVEPGLRRAYRRGRNRFEDVLDDPGDTAAHEWRKRVKDLWYQLRVLQRAWPELLTAISEEAHELSSVLGDHHDLAVVRAEVHARPSCFGGRAQTQLLELIERRQGELRAQAIPMGRRLYAEKPRRFTGRVGIYWSSREP